MKKRFFVILLALALCLGNCTLASGEEAPRGQLISGTMGETEAAVRVGFQGGAGAASVFCAFYDDVGKLISVEAQPAPAPEGSLTFPVPPKAKTGKAFLLGENLTPLCAAMPLMKYTGYYTDDPTLLETARGYLRDSKVLLSTAPEGRAEIDAMYRRINEITSSPTAIVKGDTYIQGQTYSGTAYYVDGENGDDSNDGLTPETAFRTVDMVTGHRLFTQPGDAIFFKRGSIFYDADLRLRDGVTYSAYGEGPKPILTASPDFNAPEDWELYYEKDGKRIWHCTHNDFASVGWIDFNCSDDLYASPVFEYWSPEEGYQYIEGRHSDYSEATGGGHATDVPIGKKTMALEDELTENLTFISRSRYDPETGETGWIPNTDLYLRCDQGNPAEVFQVIKLTTGSKMTDEESGHTWARTGVMDSIGMTNITLDNLEISNSLLCGISHVDHSTIQNCEVSFIGNSVWGYHPWDPNKNDSFPIDYVGDGIYGCIDGVTVRNNYVHHCCCVGITAELITGKIDAWTVDGNVSLYNGVGFAWQGGNEWRDLDPAGAFITNNYFAYAGCQKGVLRYANDFNSLAIYGWDDSGTQDVYEFFASHQHFRNNTVIGGYHVSILSSPEGYQAIGTLEGNTFVGDPMDNLMRVLGPDSVIKYFQLAP